MFLDAFLKIKYSDFSIFILCGHDIRTIHTLSFQNKEQYSKGNSVCVVGGPVSSEQKLFLVSRS